MGRKRKMPNSLQQAGRNAQECGEAGESFRIYIDKMLIDFVETEELQVYQFPSIMSRDMRAYIHAKATKLGLKSKSVGKEPNRQLTIAKKRSDTQLDAFHVDLSVETHNLLQVFTTTMRRSAGNLNQIKKLKVHNVFSDTVGQLLINSLHTVDKAIDNPLMEFRKTLPIYRNKDYILDIIENNNIIIISAETGSGKTTQIPQYILDDAYEKNKCVKIICTQPRRLSTIAIAERVAAERGETIGNTVGYQIKLESKKGPRTSLFYCTNGILLRTLMGGDDCFNNVTHIIVDEIHERDKFTDFLLICLRESIKHFPHLKIILMSATMDMDIFVNYFENVHVVNVDGRSHQITSYFLDEILLKIGYENNGMKSLREMREKNGSTIPKNAIIPQIRLCNVSEVDPSMCDEMDEAINACFDEGTDDEFANLMQLLMEQAGCVNYQDSGEGKTSLMAAARHGNMTILEQLLNMGADPFIASTCGLTASGWAQKYNKNDIVNVLSMYNNLSNDPKSQEVVQILKDYDRTLSDDSLIDHELIVNLVMHIHNTLDKQGAILIFLPGYDDIMFCNEAILNSSLNQSSYKIFMLHGSMQMGMQNQVFNKLRNKQKIILSTNIAETSITIDDVRHVIDTGKAKEKTYDLVTGISSLKTQWISMASARQRAGRAGRTQNGYCFHLYSYNRYESFSVNKVPEILRVPLHELCLQTKMLAPNDMSIEDFIQLAIDPPSSIAVRSSINSLKNLGALDKNENLTMLGNHLVHLSLDPNLGKMLIYAVIFKCLDPVLTIVACMAHRDPFNMPTKASLKNQALDKRKALCEDTLSDHMSLLRVFQMWQDAKICNRVHKFCSDNFVSGATMEAILMSRSHLLSQLRVSGFVQPNPKDNIHELNTNSHCWPLVKACMAAGLYPNVAFYNNNKLQTRTEKMVHIAGFSATRHLDNDVTMVSSLSHNCWLIYEELNKIQSRCSIRSATVISPLTVVLLCGLECEMSSENCVILDDWFEFNFQNSAITQFRSALDEIVYKKISHPRQKLSDENLQLIDIFVKMLLCEDKKYALPSVQGIGSKPKILHARINTNTVEMSRVPYSQQPHRENTYQEVDPSYIPLSKSGPSYLPPQRNNRPWVRNTQEYSNNRRGNFRGNGRRGDFNQRYVHKQHQDYNGPSTSNNQWQCIAPQELFPNDAMYFLIKPFDERNLLMSMNKHTWSFAGSQVENSILQFFNNGCKIILIFTTRTSNLFRGIATLVSINIGGSSRIDWISQNTVQYYEAKFVNARTLCEGQLLTHIGQQLCQLICNNRPVHQQFNQRPILGTNARYRRPPR